MTNNNKQNLYPVQVNDLFGYSDADGNIVIPCKWKFADDFREGLAEVQNDEEKWGYIDKNGKEVIPCIWKSVGSLIDGFAKPLELVMDTEAQRPAGHGVPKSQTRLSH